MDSAAFPAPTPAPALDVAVGGSSLVATRHGGGLRAGPGLYGYAAGALAPGGSGQVLAPWPNRLRDGRWSWRGRDLVLPLSEPAAGNAIHGLVRWALWEPADAPSDTPSDGPAGAVLLEHRLAPQPGYPFWLRLGATYAADGPDAWSATLTATNQGDEPAPFGLGQHPYLTAGTALVDDAALELGAGTLLEVDPRGRPTGERATTGYAGAIGDAVLDATFTGLARDGDGRARAVLRGPDRTVTLWADEGFRWLQVFSGDTLAPDRRRRGLAVEPMTCPPDALATGQDLLVLAPGETWAGSWGVQVG